MINMTKEFLPFTIKLADRVDKNGKIIYGKEKSFDSAHKMWEFYNLNKKPTKKKQKKNTDEEPKKVGRTLERKKLHPEMTNTEFKKGKIARKAKAETKAEVAKAPQKGKKR